MRLLARPARRLACLAPLLFAQPSSAQEPAADAVTLERDVRVLADDSMEGREAGTHGHAMAAGYVAGRMAALRLKPAGNGGTYFQSVPMRAVLQRAQGSSLVVASGRESWELTLFQDYYGSGNARQQAGTIEAPLVFIGYGLDLPSLGRDDFSGVDLTGKIAVRAFGSPAMLNTEERAHYRSTIAERLSARGAIGMLTLWTPAIEAITAWEGAIGNARHDVSMSWLDAQGIPFTRAPGIQASAVLSPDASRRLMEGEQFDYGDIVAAEATPQAQMPSFTMGKSARITFAQDFETIHSPNVIGMLPGSDPALSVQHVVLTGHLDHEGVKPTDEADDDEIHNGAMDNAVGIASMLEVARLLAADPPRRPTLFIALTAEEKGLVGSSYNAANPTVPADQVAVNLNLDMPIVSYPFTDLVAFGAERSNVFPHVRAAVEAAGLVLSPDPDPEQGLFVRSDQYSYVKQGVPAIYVKTGPANGGAVVQADFRNRHYHKPSDEAGLVDYAALVRFTNVNAAIARAVADMDERPAWNEGDFFGTIYNGPMADR